MIAGLPPGSETAWQWLAGLDWFSILTFGMNSVEAVIFALWLLFVFAIARQT